MSNSKFMQAAITRAIEGIQIGQTPFGACIVKDGEVITCRHNHVYGQRYNIGEQLI